MFASLPGALIINVFFIVVKASKIREKNINISGKL